MPDPVALIVDGAKVPVAGTWRRNAILPSPGRHIGIANIPPVPDATVLLSPPPPPTVNS
jgi:hypothetical protein